MNHPKRKKRQGIVATAILALSLAAAGCSTVGTTDADTAVTATAVAAATTEDAAQANSVDVSEGASEAVEAVAFENQDSHASEDDTEWNDADVVDISLTGSSASTDSDLVKIDGGTVTITAAGTYSLSGALSDGHINVDAADTDLVRLLLDGVEITNSAGAAIDIENANEAMIFTVEGTTNTLVDGATYVFEGEDDEPNATLFSSADLTIAGNGALIVDANYNDAIASKDGLVIEAGTITIDAVDDGIRGKDYVIVNGGDIAIAAGGDGIKSDNSEDTDRGYVLITDGTVDITSSGDGVQAATDAIVAGGTVSIDAGSGSLTEDSARGVQGDVMVVVDAGTLTVTATDDAIHSNASVYVNGGTLTLASGDDGIHADFLVEVNDGSITISESFEGIESEVITINGGLIDLTSNDDGLNVTDATSTSNGTATRGPGDETAGDYYVYINGGTTVITIESSSTADGDGIDSNGHVVMTGGVVAINGPTDTRNSAVDSNGTFEVSGGLLIGTNINGRNSEGVGDGSTQASLYLTSETVIEAGTVIHIQALDGTGVVTFLAGNEFDVIVFTSDDLEAGTEYDVYLGGSVGGQSTTGLYDDSAYTPGELAGTTIASL